MLFVLVEKLSALKSNSLSPDTLIALLDIAEDPKEAREVDDELARKAAAYDDSGVTTDVGRVAPLGLGKLELTLATTGLPLTLIGVDSRVELEVVVVVPIGCELQDTLFTPIDESPKAWPSGDFVPGSIFDLGIALLTSTLKEKSK